MESFLEFTRWVHAVFGTIALVAGTLAVAATKGTRLHTLSGRVFLGALGCAFASIIINIVVKRNIFMLGIGWLALYAGFEGWRALQRYRGRLGGAPSHLDLVVAGLTGLGAVALLAYGAQAFVLTGNFMGLAAAGFGVLGLSLVRSAWQRAQEPPPQKLWLGIHIAMMTGAFSAAVTAFLAIQLSGRVGSWEWAIWVTPTIVMAKVAERTVKQRGLELKPGGK